MNKRVAEKINKQAQQKIINGEPLTQMERITFNKYMENWLGPEIVSKIKQFRRAEK